MSEHPTEDELDDLVYDAKAEEAAAINNAGQEAQLEYLCGTPKEEAPEQSGMLVLETTSRGALVLPISSRQGEVMTTTAYLLAEIRTGSSKIVNLGVYSEVSPTTMGNAYLKVWEFEGRDFAEASLWAVAFAVDWLRRMELSIPLFALGHEVDVLPLMRKNNQELGLWVREAYRTRSL